MLTIYRLLLLVLLAVGCIQVGRVAKALNESNHIMVGVENGQVPGVGQEFKHADPPKEF
jgi:hypothetical protein